MIYGELPHDCLLKGAHFLSLNPNCLESANRLRMSERQTLLSSTMRRSMVRATPTTTRSARQWKRERVVRGTETNSPPFRRGKGLH